MKPWIISLSIAALLISVGVSTYASLVAESRSQKLAIKQLHERGGNFLRDYPSEDKRIGNRFGLEYPTDDILLVFGQGKFDPLGWPAWRCCDEDLALLLNFDYLSGIYLEGPAVTDAGIRNLEGSDRLTHFQLTNTNVTDSGIKELLKFPNLKTLDLSGSTITNRAIDHIVRFENLTTLDLSNTQISDHGIQKLANSKSLEDLTLSNLKTSDQSFDAFNRFRKLKTLNLLHMQIDDLNAKDLAKIKTLKELVLLECTISGNCLDHINQNKVRIKTLGVVYNPDVHPSYMKLELIEDDQ